MEILVRVSLPGLKKKEQNFMSDIFCLSSCQEHIFGTSSQLETMRIKLHTWGNRDRNWKELDFQITSLGTYINSVQLTSGLLIWEEEFLIKPIFCRFLVYTYEHIPNWKQGLDMQKAFNECHQCWCGDHGLWWWCDEGAVRPCRRGFQFRPAENFLDKGTWKVGWECCQL